MSMAEPREEFVVRKLAKRLDIDIPLYEVAHGSLRAPLKPHSINSRQHAAAKGD